MAMSKKDFIKLAEYLKHTEIESHCDIIEGSFTGHTNTYVKLDSLIEHLANFCHSQNPAFKRQRWIGYIKGENGPNGGKR